MTMQVVGRAQRLDQAVRQRGHRLGLLRVGLDDGEFIAAEARDGVALAHAALQPQRDLPEQLVAGRMAERVVHALEAVEIETQDRRATVARRAPHGVRQIVRERNAVGQSGERVVPRHVGDPFLGAAAFGDVLVHRHPAAVAERLDQDADGPSVLQLDHPETALLGGDLRHDGLLVLIEGRLRQQSVIGATPENLVQRRARRGQLRRNAVQLPVCIVAGDQTMQVVEHAQSDRHVGHRGLQPVAHELGLRGEFAAAAERVAVARDGVEQDPDLVAAPPARNELDLVVAGGERLHRPADLHDRTRHVARHPQEGRERKQRDAGDLRDRQQERTAVDVARARRRELALLFRAREQAVERGRGLVEDGRRVAAEFLVRRRDLSDLELAHHRAERAAVDLPQRVEFLDQPGLVQVAGGTSIGSHRIGKGLLGLLHAGADCGEVVEVRRLGAARGEQLVLGSEPLDQLHGLELRQPDRADFLGHVVDRLQLPEAQDAEPDDERDGAAHGGGELGANAYAPEFQDHQPSRCSRHVSAPATAGS